MRTESDVRYSEILREMKDLAPELMDLLNELDATVGERLAAAEDFGIELGGLEAMLETV